MIYFITLFLSLQAHASFKVLAVGDTGKGNELQYKIGEVMNKHCRRENCDMAFLLGDNIYDAGLSSVDDPQMIEKFEKPYENFPVPFHVTLGNHDYGKFANNWTKGSYQIEYSKKNKQFILPAPYYKVVKNDVLFLVLDTSQLFHNHESEKQIEFVRQSLKVSQEKWKVVLMHHPYLSNGPHGNAGKYDGVPFPPYSGSVIKKIVEKELCPYVDLIVSGHDHSLQTIKGPKDCPNVTVVVSGAGASTTELKGENDVHFEAAVAGYTDFIFENDKIQVRHFSENGDLLNNFIHTKKSTTILDYLKSRWSF